MKRGTLITTLLLVGLTVGTLCGQAAGTDYNAYDLGECWYASDLSENGYAAAATWVLNDQTGDSAIIIDATDPTNVSRTTYTEASMGLGNIGVWGPFGTGVDDSGRLVGYSQDGNSYVWDGVNITTLTGVRLRDIKGNVAVGTNIITQQAWVYEFDGANWNGTRLDSTLYDYDMANRVNANGVLTGTLNGQATLWSAGAYAATSLGSQPQAVGNGLNDLANPTVVGASQQTSDALVWTWNGSGYDETATKPDGFGYGILLDVNDSNVAVGFATEFSPMQYTAMTEQQDGVAWVAGRTSFSSSSAGTAFIYDIATDTWTDLNTFAPAGFTLNTAVAITNDGDILCNATDGSGLNHAILLEAILIPGDCDGDGDVDLDDLAMLANNFGHTGPVLDHADGDFDDDGDVDLTDLAILANNWGFGTMTAVPEPASAAVLLAGGAFAWRKRRMS